MGKMKENPRYYLLSFRVTKEEWQEIYDTSLSQKLTISDFIRKKMFS